MEKKTISLDAERAAVLLRAFEEIRDIDCRMSCSDAGFRRHFTVLAKNPYLIDAIDALRMELNK